MTALSSKIILKDIRIFAHHGVLPQERAVGAYFTLNLRIQTDFSRALATDDLAGTISYADAFEVVKAEMALPSQLLEHVAGRICQALFDRFPAAEAIHLELLKENPPMGADCAGAGIALDVER
ncbi:MAG: dihydroneopterin aldolase [Bacteroidaceae bacterium]|nr:dihydroneopterin aldolase [Bacteroidaceae bacterium]MBR1665172.1 dihydroneopterin aldolase [Bacteroidaceae bacterium]